MKKLFMLLFAVIFFFGEITAQVCISTDNSAPDPSSMLDTKSINKGVLLPRMTYDQRNAIPNPAEGLIVFCTNCGYSNTGIICIYDNGKWTSVYPCFTPAPTAAVHVASQHQIVWNWNPVPGALGYKWNTIADISSATDMGVATSKTETGLTCETAYTRYVWAYFDCGVSAAYPLTQNSANCWLCGQPFSDTRDGKIYNTTLIGTQCWMKENLNTGVAINSSQVSLNNNIIEKYCFNDIIDSCDIYGGLYQWNELMNYTASSSTNPSGRRGICPAAWHIPSESEWQQLIDLLGGYTIAGGALKEDGYRHWAYPNSYAVNTSGFTALPGGGKDVVSGYFDLSFMGYFWTSTASSPGLTDYSFVRTLTSYGSDAIQLSYDKASGFSVRCLKD